MKLRYSFVLGTSFVLVLLDQISKWAVTEIVFRQSGVSFMDWMLDAPERLGLHRIEITSFFNLVMVWNKGVSFGLLSGDHGAAPILLSILSLAIVCGFLWWLRQTDHWLQICGIIWVIGGAIGNVIDRLRFGAVIDFLDFHVVGFHWPAFNMADSLIFIGVFALLIHSFFFEITLQTDAKDGVR